MSLLSDTQGTPERICSLVNVLQTHGGQLEREGVKHWLDPFDKDPQGTALANTIGAAISLDLVISDRSTGMMRLITRDLPGTLLEFSDWVHGRLIGTPADHGNSVVLETLAWFVAMTVKPKGTTWIRAMSTQALVDQIRHDLSAASEEGRFNTTRYPRWRDWIGFMGLGLEMPAPRGATFYPYVTSRLARELGMVGVRLGLDHEIEAAEFLDKLSRIMPYLDGGHLFATAMARIQVSPVPRQLSIVLSTALREVHDDGRIELKMYGDARDAFSLYPDPTHKVQAFSRVVLKGREEQHEV